jgi:hypothetical protein
MWADAALAAQHLMCGLSDDRARLAQNQLLALYRQCLDAEQGLDGDVDYMQVPF